MKYFIPFLLLMVVNAAAQNIHSKVEIYFKSKDEIAGLAKTGLILDHAQLEKANGGFVLKTILGKHEMAVLQNSGFDYRVSVANLNEAKRLQRARDNQKIIYKSADDPVRFELGSLGGFYTLQEYVALLDSMQHYFPQLITAKTSIGKSIEGRDIWMVKISDKPNLDEYEPEVLYTALHHAREPASLTTLVYFMYYLLENYGGDPEVTYLLDNRELYFVGMINPDGYLYNENGYDLGDNYWRKNRRNNGDGSYGVDLNRNYGYEWGYDNNGSSSNPSNEVYRGTQAFSEPETRAIRDLCYLRHFRLALNYHTYSNLLIYPWGYEASLEAEDSTLYRRLAAEMTRENRYVYGTGNQTVGYLVNGDSDDWMYGEWRLTQKIFSMTPEVGHYSDGFWPEKERILPLARENLYPNLLAAQSAGGLLRVQDYTLYQGGEETHTILPGESFEIRFHIKNIGLDEARMVTLSLFDPNYHFDVPAINTVLDTLAAQKDTVMTLSGWLTENAPRGLLPDLYLKFDQNGYSHLQPLQDILAREPALQLADGAEDEDGLFEGWARESGNSYEGGQHYSDSPGGDYQPNSTSTLRLKKALAVGTLNKLYLSFAARWSIETGYDYGTVEASSDSENWDVAGGNYSYRGSGRGVQPLDGKGYHGSQLFWLRDIIDLSDFAGGDSLHLRFSMNSDGNVEFDGWHLDDIRITGFEKDPNTLDDKRPQAPRAVQLYQNYPNPFNPQTTISFYLPHATQMRLEIFDIHGRLIRTLHNGVMSPGQKQLSWDATTDGGMPVASGIYIATLTTENHKLYKRMLLLR